MPTTRWQTSFREKPLHSALPLRILQLRRYVPQLLTYISIPAHRDAEVQKPADSSHQWPVMVLSHGLGGSRNTYSHFCGSIASHGMVVFAPEHRDGSGPVTYIGATDSTPASQLEYRRISHSPSDEVYQGRDEQLSVRLWELGLLHQVLLKMNGGESVKNLKNNGSPAEQQAKERTGLAMFRGILDVHRPGAISFAGHSFGAVTTVQFVKSIFYSPQISTRILSYRPSAALVEQITPRTSMTLLDLWALPLESPATSRLNSKPLPCFDGAGGPGGASVISILSAAFLAWQGNYAGVKRILHDPASSTSTRPSAQLFYPLNSAHLSQSDFAILFPHITKYLAKAQDPERTLRLNVRAVLETLRRSGVAVADTSAADLEGDAAADAQPVDAGKGDAGILSTDKDAVRGWVALSVDEHHSRSVARQAEGDAQKQRPRPMRTLSSAAEAATGASKVHGQQVHSPMDEAFGDSELQAAA